MIRPLFVAALLLSAAPIAAQQLSQPQPVPFVNRVPAPRDAAYPGTMRLEVDATDTQRRVLRVRQTIPVAEGGRITLLFPEWLPGNHAPRGQIEALAGLRFTAGGRPVRWTRDDVNVYAFHVDVPDRARELVAEFQFVSPTTSDQGRIVVTNDMMNIQWEDVSLYPAGYFTRRIPVDASVRYPAGWTAASGLPSRVANGVYRYQTTDYETLIDSPVFAGRHFRRWQLTPDVGLNVVADEERFLAATPEQIAAHRRLVEQAVTLFGAQHYDKYEFLLALTDEMGGIGLEHHRSSENGVNPEYFTEWDKGPGRRNLLPHEFTHSWDGKYRRGAGAWTPDYSTPMRNELLWVYEGQTQFWGYILGARSGLFSKDETLDALAYIAATLDQRAGRTWRPLQDTVNDPIITPRRPKPWTSWQRSEDYYNEGMLVWLDVDAELRQLTGGERSMDDFARAFFGMNDRDWGINTYTFDDVVSTLNGIAPADWRSFLRTRLDDVSTRAPLGGFTRSGYTLVYEDTPSSYLTDLQSRNENADLSFSVGGTVANSGTISQVMWDGPMFEAGLTPGQQIVAVNGQEYGAGVLTRAITDAKGGRDPIRLTVRDGDRLREVAIDYHDGLRYPRLRKTGAADTGLDRLLAPRS
ncbi:putative metalloprotease with PDZ domain [Sphingomonas jejuensis]|uniref:Metalloprotease with PDZ domain n=1 Tax=Sphingomonas jejuensis TaxID=904715 RepID=A0ABX0XM95_9SPHN|nr:M61 family metallopeptidase [Sphingomonas jejuensis]NJC34497.1 putative metalloprotease with PDZ domain [Sphingomonas jejuensis]